MKQGTPGGDTVPKWQYINLFRFSFHCKSKFEDTKEVIKICKSYKKSQRQRLEEKEQQDKQWSVKDND